MTALCWVFSIVQRKDRPSGGTALLDFPAGGTGRLPGRLERNTVPTKGDSMGMARAGNRLPPSERKHHIFSVHTAAPYKTEIQKERVSRLADGLSINEIARREGVAPNAVMKSVKGVLEKLKKFFESEGV